MIFILKSHPIYNSSLAAIRRFFNKQVMLRNTDIVKLEGINLLFYPSIYCSSLFFIDKKKNAESVRRCNELVCIAKGKAFYSKNRVELNFPWRTGNTALRLFKISNEISQIFAVQYLLDKRACACKICVWQVIRFWNIFCLFIKDREIVCQQKLEERSKLRKLKILHRHDCSLTFF